MKKTQNILLSCVVSTIVLSSANAKQNTTLDDITVTAQKVEENIQEVPISLTVFDEFTIEDRKVESVKDIAQYTPGFYILNPGDFGTVAPTMRGLYSDPSTISTTVSMYIDGIPTQTTIEYDAILEDIERIEVLRGPQGTLYGKNAEAGAINIVTKKPDNETRGKVTLELGSDNKRKLVGSISGPIIEDKFYIGLNATHYEKDGFMNNTYLNRIQNDRKNNHGKIHLRFTPTDKLDISLISSHTKRDDGAMSINRTADTSPTTVIKDIEEYNKPTSTSHALKVNYAWDTYTIESITAYKKDRENRFSDFDFSTTMMNHALMDKTHENLSQEIRLSSQTDSFTWTSGLYADKGDIEGGSKVFSISPQMTQRYTQDKAENKSIGVFAHGDYSINEDFSLIAGIRYDNDKKDFYDKKNKISLNNDFNEVSPKFALRYHINKDITTYASIAKGYKSGGFYMFAPTGKQSYDKETLWNYEIGLKSSWLDNNLIFNSSLYYMDIKDMQVLTDIDQYQGYISNAGEATSKGLEVELNYQVNDALSLTGAFSINETKYDKFSDANGNYKGNYASFAPKYNYSIAAQYRTEQGFYARVDLSAYGKMFIDKTNKYEHKPYSLTNLKLGYETEDFDIYLYGKNVFNKKHNIEGYYNGFYSYLSKPRELGIQLNYRF